MNTATGVDVRNQKDTIIESATKRTKHGGKAVKDMQPLTEAASVPPVDINENLFGNDNDTEDEGEMKNNKVKRKGKKSMDKKSKKRSTDDGKL